MDPTFSPDGKKIVYISVIAGVEQLFTMNADGASPPLQLTHAVSPRDVRAIHPSWSIDGTQLVYCTEDDLKPPKKNPSEIAVVDLKTKKVRTLLTGGVNTFPVWSPDGKKTAPTPRTSPTILRSTAGPPGRPTERRSRSRPIADRATRSSR